MIINEIHYKMNKIIALPLLAIALISCNDIAQKKPIGQTTKKDSSIVGKKIVSEEAGSLYRKKALGYFVITKKDTAGYTYLFTELNGGGVTLDFNTNRPALSMSYADKLRALKIILPEAAKDFNLDSLQGINFGRLVSNGDLAIDVTKQYIQKFGTSEKVREYGVVSEFLKGSKLGTDLDSVFKKYSISVDEVSIEKMFFTTTEELYLTSKIETRSTAIPEKILDCSTYVRLSKK